MKPLLLLLLITAMCSCEKDQAVAPEYGTFTFYTTAGGSWNLLINGQDKGLIDRAFIPPACGDASFITARLKAGVHNYDVKSNDGLAWGNPHEFTSKDGCYVILVQF